MSVVICRTEYHRGGGKTIVADRRFLKREMAGYGDCVLLLDEVTVVVGASGEIVEARAIYRYDPERCDYFKEHFKGLLPGLGGHGEFMAQTSAASVMLTDGNGGKVLLEGADRLRTYYPVRGAKEILCIARPQYFRNGSVAFNCIVHAFKEHRKFGNDARVLSRITVRGKRVLEGHSTRSLRAPTSVGGPSLLLREII